MAKSRHRGEGQTIMPWLGKYSLMRTWLIADGNSPDSSHIFCVRFVNHGGTVRKIEIKLQYLKHTETNYENSTTKIDTIIIIIIRSHHSMVRSVSKTIKCRSPITMV